MVEQIVSVLNATRRRENSTRERQLEFRVVYCVATADMFGYENPFQNHKRLFHGFGLIIGDKLTGYVYDSS